MREIIRRKLIPLGFLLMLFCGIGHGAVAPPMAVQELTLDIAIKKGNTSNRQLQARRLSFETSKLNYYDAWDQMFMPQITLGVTTNSSYTMGRVPFGTTAASQAGDTSRAHGFPASTLSLNLGQYTLFNFWRDQIVFEEAKLNFDREKERLIETERNVRVQIITQYFRLKTEQDKLDAARRSVSISEAIVNLVKSRIRIGRASDTDLSSSNVDLLNARNQFNNQERSVTTEQRNLNILLGDPIDSVYNLRSELQYVHLSIGYDDALKIYFDNSPTMKDQRLTLKTGDMNLELAEKRRLPLPTVTISGITMSYNSGYYGETNGPSTTAPTSGNIDIGVSVGLTLPLYGPNGFLNGRDVARARIQRDQNELNYQLVAATDQANITSDIVQIRQDEENIKNQIEAFKQTAQVLNNLFAQMGQKEVNRLELRDAITNARSSELDLKDAILSHLSSKLQLMQLIGLDHLPGDPY